MQAKIVVYHSSGIVYAFAIVAIFILAIIHKVNPSWLPSSYKPDLITWLAVLPLIAAFALAVRKWIGPPWVLESIRKILNGVRNEGFNIVSDRVDFYRVTI